MSNYTPPPSDSSVSPLTFHVGPTAVNIPAVNQRLHVNSCGPCTLCCKVMGVKDPELEKPKDVWCQHAKKGRGCGIYETRPQICRGFECLWLSGNWPRPEWRPDKIHGLLTMTKDGQNFVIHEDPGYPGHARSALREAIKRWNDADPTHYVLVVTGRRRLFIGQRAQYDALRAAGAEEVKTTDDVESAV